jgi:iron complex transport system substrate-binding protein
VIDRSVRDLIQDGLSVYRIKTDVLQRLKPDLIVTQDQCEVCAVSLKDVEEALCTLTLNQTQLCTLRPNTLDDILTDIQRVADMAGVPQEGRRLVRQIRNRLDRIATTIKEIARRPTVACIEWLDPLMIAGGWMPELVQIAGGEPVLIRSGQLFSKPTWREIKEADPDVIVILPCGFTLPRVQQEVEQRTVREALAGLRATLKGRCFLVDGNAYFNRPGPRIAESTEILAYLLHPAHFQPPLLEQPYHQVWAG